MTTNLTHTPRPETKPDTRPRRAHSHGAGAGVPTYLKVEAEDISGPAEREARTGSAGPVAARPRPTPLGRAAARAIQSHSGGGAPIDGAVRAGAEATQNADFGDVRIHRDSALPGAFGARAATFGDDIHLGPGEYKAAGSGAEVLNHELTHVRQQRSFGGEGAQFLLDAHALPLGTFVIAMPDFHRAGVGGAPATAGLSGDIQFDPEPTGPYSAEIGLIQAISITESGGASPVDPMDQSGPVYTGGVAHNDVADMNAIRTTGAGGEEAGWRVDGATANFAPGDQSSPVYADQLHSVDPTTADQRGFVRSPTDTQVAILTDEPFSNAALDVDFDFQTVAMGMDTGQVYGTLNWGFEVVGGHVFSQYSNAVAGTSAEFDAAMEEHRDYFTHEPVVVYFDTAADAPMPGEEAKIREAVLFATSHPDVELQLSGFTDRRGATGSNRTLGDNRADTVAALLMAEGVDASRISISAASSAREAETTQFGDSSAGMRNTEGNLRANRRVVIRFNRTITPTG